MQSIATTVHFYSIQFLFSFSHFASFFILGFVLQQMEVGSPEIITDVLTGACQFNTIAYIISKSEGVIIDELVFAVFLNFFILCNCVLDVSNSCLYHDLNLWHDLISTLSLSYVPMWSKSYAILIICLPVQTGAICVQYCHNRKKKFLLSFEPGPFSTGLTVK